MNYYNVDILQFDEYDHYYPVVYSETFVSREEAEEFARSLNWNIADSLVLAETGENLDPYLETEICVGYIDEYGDSEDEEYIPLICPFKDEE